MTTALDLPFKLGETREAHGMAVTAIFPLVDPFAEYVGADEGFDRGLQVGEVSEEGVVGTLLARNPLPSAVLLYDGEELIGAKQNRILNAAVLIGPEQEFEVPVSCVERGRWQWRSPDFRAAQRVSSPQLRRVKARSLAVNDQAAQMAVWNTVDQSLAERGVTSPTAAAADAFEAEAPRLRSVAEAFPLENGQCGAIVVTNGYWTLDLVSRPEVFASLYPKLMAGYAFDSRSIRTSAPIDCADVLDGLRAASTATERSAALGQRLSLTGVGFVGSGLELDGELIQLCAYSA